MTETREQIEAARIAAEADTRQTVKDLRRAIKEAPKIFAYVRFGTCEKQVRVTKSDALWLVQGLPDDNTAVDMELDRLFGWAADGTLNLG